MAKQTSNKRTVGAIVLMAGPTALLLLTFLLFAIINWLFAAMSSPHQLYGAYPFVHSLINIFLYLLGIISVITWLPGLIIGIVLLATKK